jgi:hypothetical protein
LRKQLDGHDAVWLDKNEGVVAADERSGATADRTLQGLVHAHFSPIRQSHHEWLERLSMACVA